VEVANALVVGERRQRLAASDIARFLELLNALSIETDTQTAPRALSGTLQLARTYGLSVYGAAYLELAMREGFELATLDGRLRDAAKKAGVRIFS
jgi:predicted nucleic acid-binding protein